MDSAATKRVTSPLTENLNVTKGMSRRATHMVDGHSWRDGDGEDARGEIN